MLLNADFRQYIFRHLRNGNDRYNVALELLVLNVHSFVSSRVQVVAILAVPFCSMMNAYFPVAGNDISIKAWHMSFLSEEEPLMDDSSSEVIN